MGILEIVYPGDMPENEELIVEGEIIPLAEYQDMKLRDRTEREKAATHLAHVLLRLEAEKAALDAKYAPILELIEGEKDYVKKQIERCRNYIRMVAPPELGGVTNDAIDVSYRESTETVIEDESQIPMEFCEVVTKPDKRLIKAAIESGKVIPGARLQRNHNLQVKPGGKRAIANARKRKRLPDSESMSGDRSRESYEGDRARGLHSAQYASDPDHKDAD